MVRQASRRLLTLNFWLTYAQMPYSAIESSMLIQGLLERLPELGEVNSIERFYEISRLVLEISNVSPVLHILVNS